MDSFAPLIPLVVGTFLGCLLGIEREKLHKAAGVRTCGLISLGATLFTILSQSFGTGSDPSRVASQIVVGVGFLGAGVIIFHQEKLQGLTTAAAMWVAAAIGVAVGLGEIILAVIATVLSLILLYVLRKLNLEGKLEKRS